MYSTRISQQLSQLLLLLLSTVLACTSAEKDVPPNHPAINFPNILNYQGIPDSATDRSVFAYSDLGAWHGYALPNVNDYNGSFVGPYLLTQDNGVWLSKSLAKMEIINLEDDSIINLADADQVSIQSFPHKLQQSFQTKSPQLLVTTTLTFATNRSAIIKVNIQNKSTLDDLKLGLRWSGKSLLPEVTFKEQEKGVLIDFGKNDHVGWITTGDSKGFDFEIDEKKYGLQVVAPPLTINSNWESHLTQTFCFSETERQQEEEKLKTIIKSPAATFVSNEQRWNEELEIIFGKMHSVLQTNEHFEIAVKCLQTLHNNWRSAAGFLKHDGLFPSYNYEWFNGFWSWDSWKHAVAIAEFNPQLAKEQILAMYDFQNEEGMIADCVYRDNLIEEHNWRNTKPPLSAWAVWAVYEKSKDKEFLNIMYPKIVKYNNWWLHHRDVNQNGIYEYGSTDSTLIAAKWDSGMDNAVRFDDSKIINNARGGGALDQESVDLNAYLFDEFSHLAKMAAHLEKPKEALAYDALGKDMKTKINNNFYNKEEGWYFDKQLAQTEHIKIFSSEGWIPLWAKIASKEQAARVVATLLDTTKFATYIPFPTLAADHPKFKPFEGYWRGPIWLDQAYFAIEGLRNYGYDKEAMEFSRQLFDRLEGLKNSDLPIRENYHPLTGEGMESNHFSWSAAHLLLLLLEE